MTFSDRSFNQRFYEMGDLAEGRFEDWSEHNFVRYGLNRPPLAMWKLPPRVRYTPDYLTSHNLVEVQGFGKKQIIHMKPDKWEALLWWDLSLIHI